MTDRLKFIEEHRKWIKNQGINYITIIDDPLQESTNCSR